MGVMSGFKDHLLQFVIEPIMGLAVGCSYCLPISSIKLQPLTLIHRKGVRHVIIVLLCVIGRINVACDGFF